MKNLFENWQKYLREEDNDQPKVACDCLCTDCVWNKNKQCVAKEIKLDFAKTKEGKTICECLTYEVKSGEKKGPDSQKIQESIEKVLEIQVRKIYKSPVLNESGGLQIKAQLIGAYTQKLMEMIRERWTSSSEYKVLQEMGYEVQVIDGDDMVEENYILLTKELL
tara:strand:+ start:1384 stop:1878 length:495 start_codon:yes stop_codon:yes gene_type:complete